MHFTAVRVYPCATWQWIDNGLHEDDSSPLCSFTNVCPHAVAPPTHFFSFVWVVFPLSLHASFWAERHAMYSADSRESGNAAPSPSPHIPAWHVWRTSVSWLRSPAGPELRGDLPHWVQMGKDTCWFSFSCRSLPVGEAVFRIWPLEHKIL